MSRVLTRRGFAGETAASLLTFSLLETILSGEVLAAEVKPIAARWLASLDQLGGDLKGRKLTQLEWQAQVEQLMDQVELPELLKFVDFAELTKDLKFRERGERALHARFPEVEGLPTKLVFGHQIFALKKGQSVAPHGHNNMATAFLVMDGEFHGRHYDRMEDEPKHIIIKPTIDQSFRVGEYSTVSDFKDNIHWFKATSDQGFIFNIHLLEVDPQIKKRGRVYVDPQGEALSDGRIRARILRANEAYKLYG